MAFNVKHDDTLHFGLFHKPYHCPRGTLRHLNIFDDLTIDDNTQWTLSKINLRITCPQMRDADKDGRLNSKVISEILLVSRT